MQTIGEQNHFKCSSVDRFMSHRLQNAHSATRTAKKGKGEEKKRERKGSISKKIILNLFLFDCFSLLAFLTYLLSEYIFVHAFIVSTCFSEKELLCFTLETEMNSNQC